MSTSEWNPFKRNSSFHTYFQPMVTNCERGHLRTVYEGPNIRTSGRLIFKCSAYDTPICPIVDLPGSTWSSSPTLSPFLLPLGAAMSHRGWISLNSINNTAVRISALVDPIIRPLSNYVSWRKRRHLPSSGHKSTLGNTFKHVFTKPKSISFDQRKKNTCTIRRVYFY